MTTPQSPLGLTTKEVLAKIRNSRIFRRALGAGWIKPHIPGKAGRTAIYANEDVEKLWNRLHKELPPKLPYEKSKTGGYSIVELVGSIMIVLILAAISISTIGANKCAGLEAACKREIQTLNSAYQSYVAAGGNPLPKTASVEAVYTAVRTKVNGVGPFLIRESATPPILTTCTGQKPLAWNGEFATPAPTPEGGTTPTPAPTATPTATPTPLPSLTMAITAPAFTVSSASTEVQLRLVPNQSLSNVSVSVPIPMGWVLGLPSGSSLSSSLTQADYNDFLWYGDYQSNEEALADWGIDLPTYLSWYPGTSSLDDVVAFKNANGMLYQTSYRWNGPVPANGNTLTFSLQAFGNTTAALVATAVSEAGTTTATTPVEVGSEPSSPTPTPLPSATPIPSLALAIAAAPALATYPQTTEVTITLTANTEIADVNLYIAPPNGFGYPALQFPISQADYNRLLWGGGNYASNEEGCLATQSADLATYISWKSWANCDTIEKVAALYSTWWDHEYYTWYGTVPAGTSTLTYSLRGYGNSSDTLSAMAQWNGNDTSAVCAIAIAVPTPVPPSLNVNINGPQDLLVGETGQISIELQPSADMADVHASLSLPSGWTIVPDPPISNPPSQADYNKYVWGSQWTGVNYSSNEEAALQKYGASLETYLGWYGGISMEDVFAMNLPGQLGYYDWLGTVPAGGKTLIVPVTASQAGSTTLGVNLSVNGSTLDGSSIPVLTGSTSCTISAIAQPTPTPAVALGISGLQSMEIPMEQPVFPISITPANSGTVTLTFDAGGADMVLVTTDGGFTGGTIGTGSFTWTGYVSGTKTFMVYLWAPTVGSYTVSAQCEGIQASRSFDTYSSKGQAFEVYQAALAARNNGYQAAWNSPSSAFSQLQLANSQSFTGNWQNYLKIVARPPVATYVPDNYVPAPGVTVYRDWTNAVQMAGKPAGKTRPYYIYAPDAVADDLDFVNTSTPPASIPGQTPASVLPAYSKSNVWTLPYTEWTPYGTVHWTQNGDPFRNPYK